MSGAQYLAYPPVVAGGARANTIHYISNNQLIDDGEMVLMDAGMLTLSSPRKLASSARSKNEQTLFIVRMSVPRLHERLDEMLANQRQVH